MNIVHFSKNSLAGAPHRLASTLQKHTVHDVRLIDLKRYDPRTEHGWFEYDIIFSEQQEEAIEVARKADIIHLHNYLDLDSRDFAPIDFRDLRRKGVLFVRQYHSTPQIVAKHMGKRPEEIVAFDEAPTLVISQYPERFYPKARVVPNILPHNQLEYSPLVPERDGEPTLDIAFAPSKLTSAWEDRWNTKGAPETMAVMDRVMELTGCSARTLNGMPLREVLHIKRHARIILDDLVNGSFHLSGLEGVCLGKPVLCYLDARTDFVLREISGAAESPFLNVRLEDAVEVLHHLVEHPDETAALGKAARTWVETYWRDDLLTVQYTHVYNRLAQNPDLITRQRAFSLDSPGAGFKAAVLPELLYQSRRNRYFSS
ncbi:MAG: glycosyltransferase family 1 protein [Desulfocurvibacter africanus]